MIKIRQVSPLSGELKAAQTALAAGDYPKAYALYLDHAGDNPLAQFSLGLLDQYGWGRPVDRVAACRWQEQAAKGGIPAAQQALADCLRQGIHRPADAAAAAHWYEEAARSGILYALCSLGEMTLRGEGVAKDPRKAIALCGEAAQKGSVSAQVALARLYLAPELNDPASAFHWFQIAAEGHSPVAQFELGRMLLEGVGHAKDLPSARAWFETAASQGYLPAYLPTASLYFDAPVDPETQSLSAADLAKAYLWLAAAARRLEGEPQAQASRMLDRVIERMPPTWRPDLDQRVTAHLRMLEPPAPGLSAGNGAQP